MIWVHKPKESLNTQFISQLPQVFCGILQSCRLRCCAFKLFLLFEEIFDAKVTSNQKQPKTIPTTNWSDLLMRQKSWKCSCNLEQTSTTWHIYLTVWWRSVTLIQSILVIKPIFFSQYTFKLHLAWNAFDCLLWVYTRTRSDDNKHRNRSCAGELCFF